MSGDDFNKYIGKGFIAFSLIATLIFWAAFTYMLSGFTFTTHPTWKYVWSAFASFPITGTFFMALYMFKLVASECIQTKKSLS